MIGNKSKENRIKAELKALEDANATMSIKPLIDAGEFSTVSESLTEADQAIRDGKLSEYLEIAADKLPGAAQTAFKNFVITKDTALFQGLNRAVQYGDFVAKAVLYEHLMQEKKIPVEKALNIANQKSDFVGKAKQVTIARLSNATNQRIPSTDNDLVAEMGDVAILLDLLGVNHKTDPVTEAPSEKEILNAQKRMLEIYDEVKKDPRKLTQHKKELGKIMSWFTSPSTNAQNQARQDRAKRHAEKYGDGNPQAHYLIQAIEELGEVLAERDRIAGTAQNQDQRSLEIQKRAFKVMRFGADTVNKGAGIYQGKTNLEAYNMALGNAPGSSKGTTYRTYTEEEALRVIKEEFVNYNRLAGRGRDYLENIGLLWFYNYKLRIMKVMARMLRERPASALFYAGGVGPMADIDTVVSGSGLGAYMDNRLGYSIGPEMGINGLFMNPWMNHVAFRCL